MGQLGFLERENASILNSSLLSLAAKTIDAITASMQDLGLTCPLYLTQNDGTLMSSANAKRFPVYTFASGPTNSMRGAAFLSGRTNAIVVVCVGNHKGLVLEGV